MQIERVIDGTQCPVCGAMKFSHKRYCDDCEDQQKIITERQRQAKRDRAFGRLWPRE